jgi:hypothetical protein
LSQNNTIVTAFLCTFNRSLDQGRHGRFLAGKEAIVAATSTACCHRFLISRSSQGPSFDCLAFRGGPDDYIQMTKTSYELFKIISIISYESSMCFLLVFLLNLRNNILA